MTDSSVRVVLITGFLGSGKTTVLNDALRHLRGTRVGVVVNDWGELGVDESLLTNASGAEVIELPGGQNFCSCLAGSFLDAVEKLASLGTEIILVETSGLAKPATLREMMNEAQRRSGGRVAYDGMVCVVDAPRFSKLRNAVMVVDEQISYANRFVVTKVDVVDEADVEAVVAVLRELEPTAPIVLRSGEPVELDAVIPIAAVPPEVSGITSFDPKWTGWGPEGRPKAETIIPRAPVNKSALESFLKAVAARAFRIKGFVTVTEELAPILVDCVGETIALHSGHSFSHSADAPLGLTIIWKQPPLAEGRAFRLWLTITGLGVR